jgi:hypothetical protein
MKPRRFASATMASMVTTGAGESADIRSEGYLGALARSRFGVGFEG